MQTDEQKAKARKYALWKKYRWTPEMYDALFELQGGVCYICKREPKNISLAVDHEHFKISTQKINKNWHGMAVFNDKSCTPLIHNKIKSKLIEQIKDVALPISVRGLLCTGHRGCNKSLGRVDNIPFLRKAQEYLENPPAKEILDKFKSSVILS